MDVSLRFVCKPINLSIMIYQLGVSGRSLYMSLETYLSMTDEDFKTSVAFDQGSYLSHPFMDTALIDNCRDDPEEEEEEFIEEDIIDQELFDLEDIADLMDNSSFEDA